MSELKYDSTGTIVEGYSGSEKCIAIPEGITEIGRWAFFRNSSIEDVSLPSTLQIIGEDAFAYCTELKAIEIPAAVKHIKESAFYGCESLSKVVLQDGLEKISSSAFQECKSLTEIVIPRTVKTVYYGAFSGCDSLSLVSVLGAETDFDRNVFENCASLKRNSVSFPQQLLDKDNDLYVRVGIGDDNGCIIKDEVLVHHVGGKPKVYVTDGVTTIDQHAFFYQGRDERKPTIVHLPNTIRKVDAFALNDIKIEVDQTAFETTEKLVKEFAAALGDSPSAIAYSALFQSGKNWTEAVERGLTNIEVKDVADIIPDILRKEKDKCTDTVAGRAVSFYAAHRNKIDETAITKLAEALNLNSAKWKKAVKAFENEFGDQNTVSTDDIKKETVERGASDNRKVIRSELEDYVKMHYNDREIYPESISAVKEGIHYSDRNEGKCSTQALILLVNEYIDEFYDVSHEIKGEISVRRDIDYAKTLYKSEIADTIAKNLDSEELNALLKKLAFGRDYRKYIIPYARYATEDEIREYCTELNKKKRGKSKDKYQAANMLAALYLSDTAAAFEYIEKNGDIEKYAGMRNVTPDVYKNTTLVPDFGMDENGVCRIDSESGEYKAYVDDKLSLVLNDSDGNVIKSMPRKAGEKAKLEFEELKKGVNSFIKSRRGDIVKLYLRNEAVENQLWMKSFAEHPVLKQIAKAVIWKDEADKTFILTDSGIIAVDGSAYVPVGGIRPAHVLDMDADEIKKWQDILQKERKSLIVDQVWEPVITYDPKKLKNRYDGLELSNKERSKLKAALKAKGVDVKADTNEGEFDHRQGSYVFSDTNKMNLGNSMNITYHIDESTKAITFDPDLKLKRNASKYEVNTILLEMDRIAVKSRIAKDEPEYLGNQILEGYTAAQIIEFIDYAAETGAVNSNAVLQNYKNEMYPEYDAFSEFVLD